MPSLPRIRRSRSARGSGQVAARPAPVVQELTANGLTWVNVVAPDVETAQLLAERFGWHPLDVEDVVSRRQRPKVDDYEDEGYLFAVLHFPVYDQAVKRLNAAELDLFLGHDYIVTIPNRELRPVTRLFRRCQEDEDLREQLFARGSGRLLYEVLDDLFDYCFPILDKIAFKLDVIEDEMFEGALARRSSATSPTSSRRSSPTARSSSPSARPCACSSAASRAFSPRSSSSTSTTSSTRPSGSGTSSTTTRRSSRALESTNESVISHRQNDVLRLLTVFSVIDPAADDADGGLRHERRLPGRGRRVRRSG